MDVCSSDRADVLRPNSLPVAPSLLLVREVRVLTKRNSMLHCKSKSDFPNPTGRPDGPCYTKARPKAHCNVDKDGSQDELLLLAKQTGMWSEPIGKLIKLHLNAQISLIVRISQSEVAGVGKFL